MARNNTHHIPILLKGLPQRQSLCRLCTRATGFQRTAGGGSPFYIRGWYKIIYKSLGPRARRHNSNKKTSTLCTILKKLRLMPMDLLNRPKGFAKKIFLTNRPTSSRLMELSRLIYFSSKEWCILLWHQLSTSYVGIHTAKGLPYRQSFGFEKKWRPKGCRIGSPFKYWDTIYLVEVQMRRSLTASCCHKLVSRCLMMDRNRVVVKVNSRLNWSHLKIMIQLLLVALVS